jgi:hypothetical protein
MNGKEFLEFITTKEAPPEQLKTDARKDILLSFRSKSIVTKFIAFQLLGALFSLTFCPQFGLGLVQGHGIAHVFRLIGDSACAAFCGSLFLSSGMLTAFIGMKGEELWWVWRRFKFSLILLPALLWAMLMFTNLMLSLPGETIKYHLTWIGTALFAQFMLMQFRSYLYSYQTLGSKSY